MAELEVFIDGVNFGEGPRWHDGKFWYSDFYQHAVYTVDASGSRTTVVDVPNQPSGLGWLPNGDLVIVSMLDQKLLRFADGDLSEYADLSSVATDKCNDMVVSDAGFVYAGNFGFALDEGAAPAAAFLAIVAPDGSVTADSTPLLFPNGSVITPDQSTLIVGETFGSQYSAFPINDDGSLGERWVWAQAEGTAPDGCTLDADGGIWFSDATGSQVLRIIEGGEITNTITTPQPTYACMLGGDDGKTLFIVTAPNAAPADASAAADGFIYTTTVDIPAA